MVKGQFSPRITPYTDTVHNAHSLNVQRMRILYNVGRLMLERIAYYIYIYIYIYKYIYKYIYIQTHIHTHTHTHIYIYIYIYIYMHIYICIRTK